MKSRLLLLLTFAFLLFTIPAALAQDTASITGTVKDSSGAAIANAQVTVSSTEQGINRSTTTNGSGDYLFASLPIGAYDVIVSAPGFKKLETKGVMLRVGEKARNDINMQVGTSNTEITVEGAGVAQVETQSSDLAGTVSGKEVTQLELNGRNFSQLITLVPGVTNQTGQDEGQVGVGGSVAFSVNGGRTEYNNWEMDGGNVMDNGSNGTLNVYPSIDAIGEVKVLTSNYGAQYGRNGSGTVEVETKSGTSSFHGDAYEFVRNDALNSPAYFQNGIAPPYKKNDFGYTIGGPVTIPGVYNKDRQKTFFFWSQEWRRDRIPKSFNQLVPSVAERGGDFSDLCPNLNSGTANDFSDCPTINSVQTPNLTGLYNPNDPNVQALLALIPLPTTGSPGAEQYNTTISQPTNWREELIKIDHNLTDKERLTFRYIHDSWTTLNPTPLWTNQGSFPTIQTDFKGPGLSLVTRLSSTFSPTLLNEFVFSYTTDHIILNDTGAWKRPANTTFGGLFPTNGNGIIPGINLVDGGTAYGNFGEDPGYIPNGPYNSNPTYGFRDNISKIVGKHNLQFGAYFEAAQKNEFGGELGAGSVPGYLTFNPSAFSPQTATSGNPFADLLLGNIASFGQQNQLIKYYNRYKIFEPYFQDDWHVSNRLTLNLGLRMSMMGTYRERYHKAYNFDPAAYQPGVTTLNPSDGSVSNLYMSNGLPNGIVQCGVGGVPVGCMKGHLLNPAPRIGFAFDPHGNGRMAIRGGYGVFFEHTNGNEADTESLENSPPLAFAAQQNNIVGYSNIGGASGSAAPTFPLSVNAIPQKAIWPYVQQWHLDLQQQFVGNTVATISYVGTKGTHLGRETNLNQLLPVPLSQNPFKPGEAIDCTLVTPTAASTPSGASITGLALQDANVACGNTSADFSRPYLGYGSITHLQNEASSIYHALQVAVRRSYKGLDLNFAYTYSHSIDDASDRYDSSFVDSYNPSSNRASSSFDQRHVVNFGYVWDLPFFRNPGLTHSVLGGWEYSGVMAYNTGSPFSVKYNADNAGVGNGVGSGAYADIVGNPRAGVVQTPLDGFGPIYYNPAAFAVPRGLTFGDSGRNILRNPHRINFDMALFKRFAFTERMGLEFRAEAFNVFNHTEWLPIAGDSGSAASAVGASTNHLSDSGIFRPNGVHNARVLQLALKLIF